MSAEAGSPRPGAYAREIERRWSRMLERPVVLSPKDWALISDWHARSIPLSLIVESMRHSAESPGRRAAPRNLAYIAAAVEEAWEVVLDGRRASLPPAPAPLRDPVEAWRRRLDAEDVGSALHELLFELLTAYENGEAAETIDRRLDERLRTSVDADLLRATLDQVDTELAPFAERFDDATLERTRRAAVVDRLRRALDLPFLDPSRRGS